MVTSLLMEAYDDLFSYIEWDSDSQQWCDVDVASFMEDQVQAEAKAAEENGDFPRLQRVAKRKPTPQPVQEPWQSQRVNEFVTLLSNTKFIRNAQVKENIPPRAYVIVPITEYAAFKCGTKDYKWGTKAVIVQDPQSMPWSMSDFGSCLNQEFGLL